MSSQQLYYFIPDRLAYLSAQQVPRDDQTYHFFSTDSSLQYYPFEADFGPLNLGQTFAFFAQLSAKLKDSKLRNKVIVYCSRPEFNFRANSVTLIGLFMVCVIQKSAESVNGVIQQIQPALTPFRDASMGPCTYGVTVLDILHATARAMAAELFTLKGFKYDDYQFYSQVENGDLTWITPKVIAFAGPVSQQHQLFKYHPFTPQSYIPLFRARGVTAVVRLNEPCYNRADFIRQGIHHYDLPYPDGSIPSERIIVKFLQILAEEKGTVAVHCKAGLGRTGTLIGIYLIRQFNFTAREVIAWLRILRPGSVLGGQQQFLLQFEHRARELNIEEQNVVNVNQYLQQQQQTQKPLVGNLLSQNKQHPQPKGAFQPIYGQRPQGNQFSPQQKFNYSQQYNQNRQLLTFTSNSPSRNLKSEQGSYKNQTVSVKMSGRTSQASGYNQQRFGMYSPQLQPQKPTFYSPQRTKTPDPERQVNYGFGTNGRVHPDVVQTPEKLLQGRMLPTIQKQRQGVAKVADW